MIYYLHLELKDAWRFIIVLIVDRNPSAALASDLIKKLTEFTDETIEASGLSVLV